MSFRLQWKTSRDALQLLSGPYLDYLQGELKTVSATLYPKLYFSYNAMTQQTTIITTDLNRSHLWMIQHLKGLSGSIRPSEIGRLLIQCFVVTQECFRTIAEQWDEEVNGPVRHGKLYPHLCLPLVPNSNWRRKRWTTVRTIKTAFGLLSWMLDFQI